MPLITFSSPLHKDKTVYAVAGSHTQTVLQLAKEHNIPIDFGCGDGECGTCLIKVKSLDQKHNNKYGHMGGPLTDKETKVLKTLGKITDAQIEQMRVDDLPSTEWRLACQMILRDEDMLIEFPSRTS